MMARKPRHFWRAGLVAAVAISVALPPALAAMTRFVPLAEAIPAADEILAGRLRGRTVVDVRH